jgi:hypothetical protein
MKNDGIISVTIGDKTYNVEDFENICDGNNKMKCDFDIEFIENYIDNQKQKLFGNSTTHVFVYDDYGCLQLLGTIKNTNQ